VRRAYWIAAAIAAAAVASTTSEGREEARRRLARWNPLFIALSLVMIGAVIFWPKS
jgi:hypothetical protein